MFVLPKTRVFRLAKELGLKTDVVIEALNKLGVEKVTPVSPIDEDTAQALRELLAEQIAKARGEVQQAKTAAEERAEEKVEVATAEREGQAAPAEVAEAAAAGEAAVEEREEEEREPEAVLPRRAAYFDRRMLDLEAQLERLAEEAEKAEKQLEEEGEKKPPLHELVKRPKGPRPPTAVDVPPVVVVLGHVDHGKTTLLDAIRQTNVTEQEEGGITQHIGASEVEVDGKTIVFLDTPGHEAFTQLRARGAQVTDIAVLVVAADDGVMPQTIEALNHARAAGVPIIVAINKIDLPNANPDRVKQQLSELGLIPEEWGGDTVMVEISALKKQNLDELLEMILLVAELQELWADPKGEFAGVVIESRLDPSRGPVVTVLTRNGTLKVGDIVLCDKAYGRVRQLTDWRGRKLKEVGPGHPVELIGLNEVPEPGSLIEKVKSLKEAKKIAEQRAEEELQAEREKLALKRVEEAYEELAGAQKKVLRAIIKADVWGSAEALRDAMERLAAGAEELEVEILHMGVGDVSEADVMLAAASDAVVIAFRVDIPEAIQQVARDEHVQVRRYSVIYDALEDIRKELEGLLEPEIREELIGRAEVLQTFRVARFGTVAGCRVVEGKLQRGAIMVVKRNGEEVFRGTLESLRHYDRDVDSIEAPNECGVGTTEWDKWREGDTIECYVRIEIRPTLKPSPAEQPQA